MVAIYPTVEELNRWIEEKKGEDRWADRRKGGRQYAGCVITFKKPLSRNYLGYIVFADGHIGSGAVAHEMTHAALRTLGLGFGQKLHRASEEQLAQTVENLVKAFWNKWWRYAEKS